MQAKSTMTEGRLARLGVTLAALSERWFPDPLIFAFLGILVVFLLAVATGENPVQVAIEGGKGFWSLVPFTMQMVMIIIGGYVLAATPVVGRLIRALAAVPKTPRAAVAWVALFAMLTSLISWGLGLIFSGLLVRQIAPRLRGLDYRAAGAAGYLGNGAVWALGLSSSAALLMATKSSIPPALLNISGLIPLAQTIFLWQSMVMAIILMVLAVLTAYLSAPPPEHVRTAESYGIVFEEGHGKADPRTRPGEWLEYSPILTIIIVLILGCYLVNVFRTSPQGPAAALDLNTYNLIFITLGLLLHWRPRNFVRAVTECIPATGGVLLQFPFYAMIFGMIVGTGLSAKMAHFFADISTHNTYPLLVALYSAVLGLFIPSGGSKWIVEAPYVLQAAISNQVHLGWVVQIYNAAEALPNLVNPFWMLPLVGILKIRPRDLVGYTVLQLLVLAPVVFFLCWLFAQTLPFVPPAK
ncbi:MAG: Short chain fatty acid transporter [Terriglobia bacterium]|nr:MAG: Short chain fatty acid transporter [Terriglobia bacterium]